MIKGLESIWLAIRSQQKIMEKHTESIKLLTTIVQQQADRIKALEAQNGSSKETPDG